MTNTNANEIKRVDYEEYCVARREMQNELDKFSVQLFGVSGMYVEVYADFGYSKPIEAEVNWGAIGAAPAEEAVKFAQLLTKAAELAKNFKFNGYKVYYTDED